MSKSKRPSVASEARPTPPGPNAVRAPRLDGWANALLALGGPDDKRQGSTLERGVLNDQGTLALLWQSDDMAARIIEALPDEMVREGFDLRIEEDKDSAEAMEAALDEMDALGTLRDAMCFARAYGGSAILLGADDGKDTAEPLELESARVKSFGWMTPLTPRELQVLTRYADPLAPKFGEPETYRIQQLAPGASSVRDYPVVHESRLIRFLGPRVGRKYVSATNPHGWGDSVLARCWQVVRDYQVGWSAAATLLTDFAQAVMKIQGLAELMAANDDDAIASRLKLIQLSRSVARMVVLDSEEEFERKPTPLSGLPEMLQQMALRIAAAARIPVTILMGQAPAGLQATGASDIRWFYDTVASEQQRTLRPALNRVVQVLFASRDGPTGGAEPDNWTVEFRPLWQLTEGEAADLRLKQAQVDKLYVDSGVLMPEEVAVSRFGGDAYSTETTLDQATREKYAAGEPTPASGPGAGPGTGPPAGPNGGAPPAPGAAPGVPEPPSGPSPGPGPRADSAAPGEPVRPAGAERTEQAVNIDDDPGQADWLHGDRRADWDPNQPRDRDGKFGSGGGGGAGGASAVPAAHGSTPGAPAKRPQAPVRDALGRYTPVQVREQLSGGKPGTEIVADLGGDRDLASTNIDGWRSSSINNTSLAMRGAALVALHGSDAEYGHALEREAQDVARAGRSGGAAAAHQVLSAPEPHQVDTFRAVATVSQAAHPEESIVVHRGVYGAQAKQIKEQIASGAQEIELGTGTLSSFTEEHKVADRFARDHGLHGVVLSIRIPTSSIAISHRAFSEELYTGEKEIIVATRGSVRVPRAGVQVVR